MGGAAPASSIRRTTPLATLGWGFYLAVSWTWVIGMILPALMLRDFGWWGLVVFLVPNAVGAALMGTVLRDAEAARRLRQVHDKAVRRFSMVTIAFHLYVLGAIGLSAAGFPSQDGQMGVLILATVFALVLLAIRRWLVTALLVWLTSVGLAIAFVGGQGTTEPFSPEAFAGGFSRDLLMLTPVVVFGFALCPYLDATFLRARSSTGPLAGRAAFAFGFLVPFVIMIGFTVLYAGLLVSGHVVGWHLVLAHLALQGGFTIAVHLREAKLSMPERAVTLLLTLGGLLASWGLPNGMLPWASNMLAWEVVYRLFLSAYGLFFPAYVLYAMVPDALGLGPMPRLARLVTSITIGVVLPMYAMGFVAREEQWLPLAFGLVLGGAFITFVMRRRVKEVSDG